MLYIKASKYILLLASKVIFYFKPRHIILRNTEYMYKHCDF